VVEQFFAVTLGFADIIMVASLGEAAVSGVSLVDTLSILITNIFAALATGGAVVCSHYIGSRSYDMASRAAKQLLYAITGIALILTILGLFFMAPLISALFGRIEEDVMWNSHVYFFYMLLSYPLIALYNAGAALFRAQGNSMVSMYIAFLVNVLNIGGNALCIYGLRMGVEGVAIPTLISRGAAAVVLLALLYRGKPYGGSSLTIKGLSKFTIDMRIIKHILAIGIPNGIEGGMFQVGKILTFTLITTFGTSAIAANSAAGTITTFSVLPGSAMGLALLTVVGQCLGARRPGEAVYFTWKLMLLAHGGMLLIGIPLLIFSRPVTGLFKLLPGTSDLARHMFILHILFSLAVWPLSFTLPNALRAANDARFTMIVSLISMWTVRVGLSYVFVWYAGFGPMSIWYAMILDWFVRGAAFMLRFKGGRWRLHCQIDA
jgi:putative MATE family efflux protein